VQKIVKLAGGGIRLLLSATTTGAFAASARTSHGSYGRATVSGSSSAATITIRPTKAAARLLAHSASLNVAVALTFTASRGGGAPLTRTVVVTLHH
jgi:hypothetical protein